MQELAALDSCNVEIFFIGGNDHVYCILSAERARSQLTFQEAEGMSSGQLVRTTNWWLPELDSQYHWLGSAAFLVCTATLSATRNAL